MSLNEADTCRVYVTPGLREVVWETSPYSITEQYTFTDGRVEFVGNKTRRGEHAGFKLDKFVDVGPYHYGAVFLKI
ncbi:MAG: hypothetical protein U9N50_02030 [Pseudomonadota bacterium]|nr:hypothetical protein [Pseudomonadota bacterium]